MKYRGEDAVVASWFGEGATSEGDWHEGLNFAGIHKLPVVFVCENNHYAISVPQSKQMAVQDVATAAEGYGFPGVVVDGNDVLACYAAMKEAHDRARAGEGPTLIECKTYRFLGHTSDDDDKTYRTRDEVDEARHHDPVDDFAAYLAEHGVIDDPRHERAPGRDQGGDRRRDRGGLGRTRPRPRVRDAPRVRRGGRVTEKNLVTAIRDALHDEIAADERVVLLGEDVGNRGGVFRVSAGWMEEFGEHRIIDTPLAESGIVGVAIGMAMHGMLPVAEIQFADFIHPAFNQIVSEAARIRYRSNGDFSCPLVIRTPCGGGIHGALYHSQSIEAFFAHVPGLKVVMPSTPADAAGLLRSAIHDPDPVLFLEHKKAYRAVTGEVPDGPYEVPIGVADVKREGDDAHVRELRVHPPRAAWTPRRGWRRTKASQVEVVDVRTLAPLDTETILASVRRTSKAMVVYEDNRTYGAGAEIAATIAEEAMYDLDAADRPDRGPRHPRDAVRGSARALLHGPRARPRLPPDAGAGARLTERSSIRP